MNLMSLDNQVLRTNTRELVATERKITLEILHHLAEIERRMLYVQLSYSSLFEYCLHELQYTAAQAQTLLRAEKSEAKKAYSPTQKLELVQSMEGLSTRDTERALQAKSPAYTEQVQTRISSRAITNELTELKLVVDSEFMQLIEKVRSACAHNRDMSPSPQELLKKGLELLLGAQKKKRKNYASVLTAPKVAGRSRYIPAPIKREVATRAQGRCEFMHPDGRRCDSSHAIEIHHFHAFAKGGANTTQNLKLFCRTHNVLEGVREFGVRG